MRAIVLEDRREGGVLDGENRRTWPIFLHYLAALLPWGERRFLIECLSTLPTLVWLTGLVNQRGNL